MNKNGINIECMQNNVRKSLVRKYTYLRKLKGLTQAEVAERAGISRTNVSRFESGGRCGCGIPHGRRPSFIRKDSHPDLLVPLRLRRESDLRDNQGKELFPRKKCPE